MPAVMRRSLPAGPVRPTGLKRVGDAAGEVEITVRETARVVAPEPERHLVVVDRDVGMVSGLLGESGDAVDEDRRSLEIGEAPDAPDRRAVARPSRGRRELARDHIIGEALCGHARGGRLNQRRSNGARLASGVTGLPATLAWSSQRRSATASAAQGCAANATTSAGDITPPCITIVRCE